MKKILSMLAAGALAIGMAVIPVQADDTHDVIFQITYLGDQNTDPVYLVEDAENYSTYKAYAPMEASYELVDASSGETIQSGELVDGEISVSGSLTFYTLKIEGRAAGSTIHIAEKSGMVITNGNASSEDGATFTVGSESSANNFVISVGNARTLEQVGTPVPLVESTEEAAEEEAPEPAAPAASAAVTEQSHDCSSYGDGYEWDSIRGSCVLLASPSPAASASPQHAQVSLKRPALLMGSALGVFLLLWAVWMLRRYGRGRKK